MSGEPLKPSADPIELKCLEIWGGAVPTTQAVSVPGLDIYVRSETHAGGASGGDVYYVSQCGAGNIARLMLADVAGHGDSAGGVARKLAALMRKHINTPDQTELTRAINTEFDALDRAGRFATALLATYFGPSDHLILVTAGHPPPLIYRPVKREWAFIKTGQAIAEEVANTGLRDLPLGIIEPTAYSQIALPLDEHDVVVLYTDAFIETSDRNGQQLGSDGLLELARLTDPGDPGSLAASLFDQLAAYRDGDPADDDQTLVVLHHNGASASAMSLGARAGVLGRMLGLLPSQLDAVPMS